LPAQALKSTFAVPTATPIKTKWSEVTPSKDNLLSELVQAISLKKPEMNSGLLFFACAGYKNTLYAKKALIFSTASS
jgi:hypothetical protein